MHFAIHRWSFVSAEANVVVESDGPLREQKNQENEPEDLVTG